jgi:hypothetical protein
MTLSTTGRYVLMIVVTFSFLACATPPNIREKSAVGNALYTDVLAAQRTFTSALAEELTRRDIVQAENAVRLGEANVALEKVPAPNSATVEVVKSLRGVETVLEIAKRVFGTVDRFLQITVVDEKDVAALTDRAKEAAGEVK